MTIDELIAKARMLADEPGADCEGALIAYVEMLEKRHGSAVAEWSHWIAVDAARLAADYLIKLRTGPQP